MEPHGSVEPLFICDTDCRIRHDRGRQFHRPVRPEEDDAHRCNRPCSRSLLQQLRAEYAHAGHRFFLHPPFRTGQHYTDSEYARAAVVHPEAGTGVQSDDARELLQCDAVSDHQRLAHIGVGLAVCLAVLGLCAAPDLRSDRLDLRPEYAG